MLVSLVAMWVGMGALARGDEFRVRLDDGEVLTSQARLVAESRGTTVLEQPDGQFRMVPSSAIVDRIPGDDPTPLTPAEVCEKIRGEFADRTTQCGVFGNYVVVAVLTGPVDPRHEKGVRVFVNKGGAFMNMVERSFLAFLNRMKIESEPPRFALPLIVFESDRDFQAYIERENSGNGSSPTNAAGYYSMLTNRLVIRMSECATFETPLHEAIHQQMHNRGLLQRLAPVPAWFNEGIATAFESNLEQVNVGPTMVHSRFGYALASGMPLGWQRLARDDGEFIRGDQLSGEAYARAWGLHWWCVTRQPKGYVRYLETMRRKTTLQEDDGAIREADFVDAFGMGPTAAEADFRVALSKARPMAGAIKKTHTAGLGELELSATQLRQPGFPVQFTGKIRNVSTFRPLSFTIRVESQGALIVEWRIPKANPLQTISLDPQLFALPGAGPGAQMSYEVHIESDPVTE